jgi:type I restriction enzyme, S subunit
MREVLVKVEEFKDSPVGRIPKDWEVFKLSEVVPRAEYGISVSLDDEVGIPVLRMNNLKNGEVDITDLKKSSSSKAANLLLQPFDVLFNRTNSIEHVGRTAIWRGQIEQASFASYLVRLVPEQSKLIPEYLNIWLNLPSTQILIRGYATPGVHQVNINPTNLRKVLIALPQEVSEQRHIAEILETVDDAIAHTSSLITKLKQIKAGLLHDLLTCGLDEDGHLRDPEAHPEEFKDSALGRIPRDWDVMPIQKAASQVPGSTVIGPFGSNLLADDYRSTGVPVVFVRDIKVNGFQWNSYIYVEYRKARQLLAHSVLPGDLLATKMGLPPCIASVYPEWMAPGIITADIIRLRPDTPIATSEWLSMFINSDAVIRQVRGITGGVTRDKVTLQDFRKLLVALPNRKEQKLIMNILDTHDTRIRKEEAYLNKLKLQKQGLMHDLLTGKVRVNNIK